MLTVDTLQNVEYEPLCIIFVICCQFKCYEDSGFKDEPKRSKMDYERTALYKCNDIRVSVPKFMFFSGYQCCCGIWSFGSKKSRVHLFMKLINVVLGSYSIFFLKILATDEWYTSCFLNTSLIMFLKQKWSSVLTGQTWVVHLSKQNLVSLRSPSSFIIYD